MNKMPVRSLPLKPLNPASAAEPRASNAPVTTELSKPGKDRPLWWLPGTVYLFPLGYVAGRVYRESYIGQLGLLESDLTLAADEYVYRGFLALVSLADHLASRVSPELAAGWYLSFLSLGVLVTLVIFATSRFSLAIGRRLNRLKDRAESFRKNSSGDFKASLSVVMGTWITAVAPVLALFTVALLVLPAFLAGLAGKLDAQSVQQSVRSTDAEKHYPSAVTASTVAGVPRELVIECRPSVCIVFTGRHFSAVRREAIQRIEGVSR